MKDAIKSDHVPVVFNMKWW